MTTTLALTIVSLANQIASISAPRVDFANLNCPFGEVAQMATDIQCVVKGDEDATFAVALASAIISLAEARNRDPLTPGDDPWVAIERISYEMLDEVSSSGVEVEAWAPLPDPFEVAAEEVLASMTRRQIMVGDLAAV